MKPRPKVDEFVRKLIESPGVWAYASCAHQGDTLCLVGRRLVEAGARRFQVDATLSDRVGFCVEV